VILYPAIDLRNGVCVRLMHGRFDQQTVYDDQPAARLARFVAAGAGCVHVVDLDGAEQGRAVQHELIGGLASSLDVGIQAGGGVRTLADVAALLGAGVSRVVVGSLAVTKPDQVLGWMEGRPDKFTLALDVRVVDGRPVPALKGWTEAAETDLWAVLDQYAEGLARHLLVTDVGRDGDMTGPNLDLLAEIRRRRPDLKLQASGGVGSLDDIAAVRDLGCDGVIVGRALYEGRFTLEQALQTASA
jgi:phosphoribosylformimino-5-aminoimidazole carboxamide ribotide isomerase